MTLNCIKSINKFRQNHKRMAKCFGVTFVAMGGCIGILLQDHYTGLAVEVFGLYLVELI